MMLKPKYYNYNTNTSLVILHQKESCKDFCAGIYIACVKADINNPNIEVISFKDNNIIKTNFRGLFED